MDENKFEVFTNDMKVKTRVKCGGVAVGGRVRPFFILTADRKCWRSMISRNFVLRSTA